jgi:hypothetical protein
MLGLVLGLGLGLGLVAILVIFECPHWKDLKSSTYAKKLLALQLIGVRVRVRVRVRVGSKHP